MIKRTIESQRDKIYTTEDGRQLCFSFYYKMTEDPEHGNLGTHQTIVKIPRPLEA